VWIDYLVVLSCLPKQRVSAYPFIQNEALPFCSTPDMLTSTVEKDALFLANKGRIHSIGLSEGIKSAWLGHESTLWHHQLMN
jgi:hypothetical protein